MKTHRTDPRQQIHILLAGCVADDERIIKQWLTTYQPKIQISCLATTPETLMHLETSLLESYNFPRLALLGLADGGGEVWQLIQEIKARYNWLPLVFLSDDDRLETIQQAYQQGVNVFVSRVQDTTEWHQKLRAVAYYLFRLIDLPSPPFKEEGVI